MASARNPSAAHFLALPAPARPPRACALAQSPCLHARPRPVCSPLHPSWLFRLGGRDLAHPLSTRAESAAAGLAQTTARDGSHATRTLNLLEPGPNDTWDWCASQQPPPAGARTLARTHAYIHGVVAMTGRASHACVQGHEA